MLAPIAKITSMQIEHPLGMILSTGTFNFVTQKSLPTSFNENENLWS